MLHTLWRRACPHSFCYGGRRGRGRGLSLLGGGGSGEARDWLVKHKRVDSHLADEIIALFKKSGGTVSTSSLSQLGDKGLQQLVESVRSDLKEKEEKRAVHEAILHVHINNPRVSNTMKTIELFPDETLYDTINSPVIDDLEFACGGNAACSTCHVIVDETSFAKLTPPEEDELDMLDLAWEPTETSRLACQMKIPRDCDGIIITIPQEANNLF